MVKWRKVCIVCFLSQGHCSRSSSIMVKRRSMAANCSDLVFIGFNFDQKYEVPRLENPSSKFTYEKFVISSGFFNRRSKNGIEKIIFLCINLVPDLPADRQVLFPSGKTRTYGL